MFTHEVLAEGLTQEEAERQEKALISSYKANNKQYGYNIAEGGRTHAIAEDTKEKISATLKANYVKENHPNYGKKYSKELRKKLSEAHKGTRITEEQKAKQRQTNLAKGIRPNEEAMRKSILSRIKPVIQYDLDGNKLNEYESAKKASIELGISNVTIGKSCMSNGIKMAGGYKWRFKEVM